MTNLLMRLRQYAQHGITAGILILLIYAGLLDGVTIDVIEAGYLTEILTLLNIITVDVLSNSLSVYQLIDIERLFAMEARAYLVFTTVFTLIRQFSPIVYINAP